VKTELNHVVDDNYDRTDSLVQMYYVSQLKQPMLVD